MFFFSDAAHGDIVKISLSALKPVLLDDCVYDSLEC